MIYFTADQHFFHLNIIQYTNRPFMSQSDMNKAIVEDYNNIVKDEDTVYHLGDLTMIGRGSYERVEAIVKKLKGRKIFILGNHDDFKPFAYIRMGFESAHTSLFLDYKNINIDGFPVKKILLIHDPAYADNYPQADLVLCGHVHTMFKNINNIVNVGVDVWDYKPVSMEEILPYLIESIKENFY